MSWNEWINQVFEANAVNKGGIVRRNIGDVIKFASPDELIDEVKKRGFHLIETGEQFVIICNSGALKIYC